MAIDMSTVKEIHYNNKEIKKIEMNGSIIWQKVEAKVLQSITLSGQTTSLNRGAAFSFGGTVTAHYSDSSTANVTSSTTFSGYNMAKAGTYTVTASYTENGVTKTATYSLTVNKAYSTVWSGSEYAYAYNDQSGTGSKVSTSNVLYTIPSNITQIRVTFTTTYTAGTSGATSKWRVKNANISGSTSSPYVISGITTPTTTPYMLHARGAYYTSASMYVILAGLQLTTSRQIKLRQTWTYPGSTSPHNYKVKYTITKIEAYY